MKILILVLIGWAVMALVMTALWFIQKRTKNAGIVDVAWTLGVGTLGILFAFGTEGYEPRRWIIGVLAGLWSLRLAIHLLQRIGREPEDGRYKELREAWGEKTQFYMFLFFQVQAFWSMLFALPMLVAAHNPSRPLGILDIAGVLIWIVAVAGEGLADRQLARFKQNPSNRGKVCRQGLWQYSRHPNYFFEWVHWWAYVLLGITGPSGWLTLFGPAVMLFFLFKVTGIPPTEARALKSRGEAYKRYQETTSAFFPWPPRDSKNN
jgi:steroid 5-alpha reductase family enzyme